MIVQSRKRFHHKLEIYIENQVCTFYVAERPHLQHFLEQVSKWYNVIIFTAAISTYADQVIDRIDRTRSIYARYYRNHCRKEGDSYVKDLSILKLDLSKCILVDNSQICYSMNQENGYPIEPFLGENEYDQELLHLLKILENLSYTDDVRSFLSLRLDLH
jgi:CTD nuclear envelope phosphatase 1